MGGLKFGLEGDGTCGRMVTDDWNSGHGDGNGKEVSANSIIDRVSAGSRKESGLRIDSNIERKRSNCIYSREA